MHSLKNQFDQPNLARSDVDDGSSSGLPRANEKIHILAFQALMNHEHAKALYYYELILQRDHLDLFAARCAHDLSIQYLGYTATNSHATIARILPSWNPTQAGFASVLGMYAQGLADVGQFEKSKELAERAMSMEGRLNNWALLALTSGYAAQGQHNIGASILKQRKSEWEYSSEELDGQQPSILSHVCQFLNIGR